MSKSRDAFRTISEVADWLGTQPHVLRFWESKFNQVKPVKRAGGRRYYRPADMLLLGGIKHLLHDEGLTIKGAQKAIREHGIKHVAGLSQPLDDDIDDTDITQELEAKAAEPAQDAPEAPSIALEPTQRSADVVPLTAPAQDAAPAAPIDLSPGTAEEPAQAAEAPADAPLDTTAAPAAPTEDARPAATLAPASLSADTPAPPLDTAPAPFTLSRPEHTISADETVPPSLRAQIAVHRRRRIVWKNRDAIRPLLAQLEDKVAQMQSGAKR